MVTAVGLSHPVEAAQFLERTPKTLAQWRYGKKGPAFVKVRHRIYYDKRALATWLKKQTQAFGSNWS
jgi:hypothetical protein